MAKFRGSKIPERISVYNYVAAMTLHANPNCAATTWVVSANTRLVICFGFLVDFLLFSSDRATIGPILMINTSYDVFPHNEVLLWVALILLPFYRVKISFLGRE